MIKKAIFRTSGLAILVAAGWYGYHYYKQLPSRQESIPTTKAQRGDVVIRAFTRGELHAVRSVTLIAPNLNGTVQVTALAPVGALAHEKDLIIDYDDSERLAALEEAQLSVQSVDEQIKKVKADMAIQQSQDSVTLLKTRYDVRRAELEVQRNPIIDEIDAKKNILNLEQSKRALQQLESDIKARQDQADSQLAVYNEQRNRSLIDVTREMGRIAQTKSLAPITGLVAIRQNRAGFFNFGQQMPDIREGDTLQPGMPVADLLDLSELDVWTKIGELDRANLREGQDALLQLDAVPDKQFHGKIKAMSGTAASDVFSGDPSKKFDVIFSVDMRQLLTGLGMKSADVDRIMATAEANAKKHVVNTAQSFFSNLQGGMQGATGPQGTPGQANGMPASADASGGNMEPAGGDRRGRGGRGEGGRGRGGDEAGGRGAGGRSAESTGRGTLRTSLANPLDMLRRASASPFTEEERKNAKLPLPPEQDSQVQTLLRPGLLADVEIVVEKIPDALHVPRQAVFDKNGRPTVFVLQKNGRFEPREVQLLKQSESTMVLSSGVRPGETIALSDPTADRSDKKAKSGEKKSGGGSAAMGGMGGGK
jgi:HlyD family secretion protein